MGDDDLDDDDDDEDDEDDDDEDDVDIWLNFRLDEVSHKDMECRRCTFSAVYWVRSFTTERKKCVNGLTGYGSLNTTKFRCSIRGVLQKIKLKIDLTLQQSMI